MQSVSNILVIHCWARAHMIANWEILQFIDTMHMWLRTRISFHNVMMRVGDKLYCKRLQTTGATRRRYISPTGLQWRNGDEGFPRRQQRAGNYHVNDATVVLIELPWNTWRTQTQYSLLSMPLQIVFKKSLLLNGGGFQTHCGRGIALLRRLQVCVGKRPISMAFASRNRCKKPTKLAKRLGLTFGGKHYKRRWRRWWLLSNMTTN